MSALDAEEPLQVDEECKFRVDLIELSKRHIAFLQAMHAAGVSLSRPSAESCRRYELWLPLAEKHPDEDLVPPADIAWLWHCHRLAPYRYAEHCRRIFGAPVEANPPFSMQHATTAALDETGDPGAKARQVWAATYPDEPFYLNADAPGANEPAPEGAGVYAGFDVLASAERQSTFLWQVSGPRYADEEFLSDGVVNYKRFIKLMTHKDKGKTQMLVPTYQIDLMWHTHLLANFGAYNEDCIEIMGKTLNHDGTSTATSTVFAVA